MAFDATTPPVEYISTDGHTIVGLQPDLVSAIGKVLNLKLKFVNASFDTIIPGVVDHKYDFASAGMFSTAERMKLVDFVSYEKPGNQLYVGAGSSKTYNGEASLCGAKVAVETGTTEQQAAENQSKKCQQSGKPAVKVLTYQTGAEEVLAVESGRADVGFDSAGTVEYAVQQSKGKLKLSGSVLPVAGYSCITLPKGSPLDAAVQAAINELIANGTYHKIFVKWGQQGGQEITHSLINPLTPVS